MDGAAVGKAIGAGLATGGIIASCLLVTLLPASWVMNRFIYHSKWMRVIMGLIAAAGSVFSFLILIVGRVFGAIEKTPYISLLPIWETAAPFASLKDIVSRPGDVLLWNPFNFNLDIPAITATIKGFTAQAGETVVNEELFAGAQKAAAITDHGAWQEAMAKLATLAKDQKRAPPAEGDQQRIV